LSGVLLLSAGCAAQQSSVSADVAPVSLQVADILRHCGNTYERLKSLHAAGVLRDHRRAPHRDEPITWDVVRPDRARFQIGVDIAIIASRDWWTWDPVAGRFDKRQRLTGAPLGGASLLLSGRISLLTPSLIETGAQAFADGGRLDASRWSIQGLEWRSGFPCYVVAQRGTARPGGRFLRVWIDQDSFVVRAWSVSMAETGAEERFLFGCDYDLVILNQPIPDERFRVDFVGRGS